MPPPRPTIRDADDSIVLSDLVRTGEASRLRRRGAIRSSHQRVASASTSGSTGGSVVYRLFCRGGEDAGTGEGEGEGQGWSDEPFRPELFSTTNSTSTSTSKGKAKQHGVGGCGALIHLSAFTTPTDSHSYTSTDKPTSLVVPLDAVYFRQQQQPVQPVPRPEDPRSPYPPSPMYSTEVEHEYGYGYFDPSHKRPEDPFTDINEDPCVLSKNACGCITEGVGCQSCGTPIGTRFRPCRAARHAHSHHSRTTTTTTTTTTAALDFTLSRLHDDEEEEDSGDEAYVEYTFFADVVDAVAYPNPNPLPIAHPPPETDTDFGRWGRRTSLWMPPTPAPVQRPHFYSYFSTSSTSTTASAYTIPLLESREPRDRDILADFLRRTTPGAPVFVPPPPSDSPLVSRSRPIPRRRMRVGEDEVEDSLRRAEDVLRMIGVGEEDEEEEESPSTPTIPIPIASPTLPTPDLVFPPSPSSPMSDSSLTPTQTQPQPDNLPFSVDSSSDPDPDPEVTRALGLPWVGFVGTPTEEIDEPDFGFGGLESELGLGVLFDGGEPESEAEPENDDEAEEEEEEEEEDPWRTMPALRDVSDTDDSSDDERGGGWGFNSDSDSDPSSEEDEDEDENTPPIAASAMTSWYSPPLPPLPLPPQSERQRQREEEAAPSQNANWHPLPPPPPSPPPTTDREFLLREMEHTRILTAALRRRTLPLPPPPPPPLPPSLPPFPQLPVGETIPYAPAPPPRAPTFSMDSPPTPIPMWAPERNWDVDHDSNEGERVSGGVRRALTAPRMERSFAGMGMGDWLPDEEDEDEDEGDEKEEEKQEEKEEDEDGAVVIKTGNGGGVLFAM
ncbi:hypothetical protein PQX77_004229 [Marasmius sp. AFHP31]|nr:hypothetical protein PQX77_004229 [Marasmius sp. AFHP31]